MKSPSLAPVVAAGLCLAGLAGCSDGAIRVPPLDPEGAASQALAEYDADKDGAITGPELDRCPGLKAGRRVLDANNDGRIAADEIAARLRRYQEDRSGLYAIYVEVVLDGQPLADATVTLVPEKFMGPGVKPASGTTSAGGGSSPQIEGAERPGVHPGIFRIEVSKKDASGQETIPARYNTQTTLGVEVGVGSPVLQNALELKLSRR